MFRNKSLYRIATDVVRGVCFAGVPVFIALMAAKSHTAFAVASVISTLIIIAGVALFARHVMTRMQASLGRRIGWIVYLLVAPWAAMPGYYQSEIANSANMASFEVPEVVLPTSSKSEDKSVSISLRG